MNQNINQIGIYLRPGSFSDRWAEYCAFKKIPFREVDLYRPDVIQQVQGIGGLLWHWSHNDPRATQMARQLTLALERMGLTVFPNSSTCWHYDDKVGQKYLLDAISAPVPKSWVFYDLPSALAWVEEAEFPLVFKLRSGAGSANVRLVKKRVEARLLCRKAFSSGFPASGSYFSDVKTKIRKVRSWKSFKNKLLRAPGAYLHATRMKRLLPRSCGYVLFQEYLAGNNYDTRITVIGNRAFGFIRRNRPNDFRASGSGYLVIDPNLVDTECVQVSFDIARKLNAQSLAFDMLWDEKKRPIIVEISYCYMAEPVYNCPGHWDSAMNWRKGHVWPQDAILEDLMESLKSSK